MGFFGVLMIIHRPYKAFSTEALENTGTEEVRVADLEDDNSSGMPVAIYGGIVVILIAIIASRKRSQAKKQ